MAVKLRLARWGAKKNPYYRIVVADSRAPRDGKYIETIGKYNPMVDDDKRYSLQNDRIQYWLNSGATPTDRVHKIFAKFGLLEAKSYDMQNKKSLPKAKAQERLKALTEAPITEETKIDDPKVEDTKTGEVKETEA